MSAGTLVRPGAGGCGPRLPFGPLEDVLDEVSARELANRLRVTKRTVQRWRSQGIPWAWADAVAILAGTHPAIVWGQQWKDLDQEAPG